MFGKCTNLRTFDFSTVKEVKEFAFAESGLEAVVSTTIESIGGRAFANCMNLRTITLPKLEQIGDYVFSYTPAKEARLGEYTHTVSRQEFHNKDGIVPGYITTRGLNLTMDPVKTCSICYELLKDKDISRVPCGHVFHTECIKIWYDRRADLGEPTCPIC